MFYATWNAWSPAMSLQADAALTAVRIHAACACGGAWWYHATAELGDPICDGWKAHLLSRAVEIHLACHSSGLTAEHSDGEIHPGIPRALYAGSSSTIIGPSTGHQADSVVQACSCGTVEIVPTGLIVGLIRSLAPSVHFIIRSQAERAALVVGTISVSIAGCRPT